MCQIHFNIFHCITRHLLLVAIDLVHFLNSLDGCKPYSIEACRDAAIRQGLKLGSRKYEFEDNWTIKGCYYYKEGSQKGTAFYGTGGTLEQMARHSTDHPQGYDCKKEEENISK